MEIEYHDDKRALTLANRGLDFCDAPRLFAGTSVTLFDDRREHGEARWLTYGWMDGWPGGRDGVDAKRQTAAHHLYAALPRRGGARCRTGKTLMTHP